MRTRIAAVARVIAWTSVVSCGGPRQPVRSAASSAPGHAESVATTRNNVAKGTVDQLVDVGEGLRLHIHCDGEGTPLVVFDSGLGEDCRAWERVQPRVAEFTRACAYDRASRGRSDPARRPHSNRQMARELSALLDRSSEPGPYVLVGHSMGGTNVQLLLAEHPLSVAGMVLIDASPEPPPVKQIPAPAMADFERNIAALEGLDLQTLLAGFDDLRTSGRSLGDKPLVVLIAGRASPDPNFSEEQLELQLAARQDAQKPLARLSANSLILTARHSAHHIPHESPELVVQAVQKVVEAARGASRLSEAALREAL